MELSLEEEAMAFTAAIFTVRYIRVVFNTTIDFPHWDIISEVNN
jgi:hypothetical protein